MEPVFEWGLTLIRTLQAFFGSAGVDLARVFTFLGNQEFYLLLFPFLLWCVDWAIGMRLTILYLLSVAVNTDVKDVIQQARPYTLEAGINPVEPDAAYIYGEGYGMPSGHAQLSATVWGVIALWMRKPWFWVLALFMPLAIGLSRLIWGCISRPRFWRDGGLGLWWWGCMCCLQFRLSIGCGS